MHDRFDIYTYTTSLKADKEDWDLEFTIELIIKITIESVIDLSHETTWNHMDQPGLISINMNEHGLAWTNMG